MTVMLRVLLAVIVLTLLALVVWQLRRASGVVVLGGEIAEARRRDAQVRRGPSPLPPGSYTAREQSLVHPEEVPLDAEIREVVERFAASDETTRRSMREAISTDEFYLLATFAHREAVFAMRDGMCERLVSGFTALAMIDKQRIDYRDAHSFPLPLDYAARRCGVDPQPLIARAAAMSTREMREVLESFSAAPESHKTLESSLLRDVGTGFIGRGIASYEPTRDLVAAALKAYHLLDADHYPGSSVSMADDFSDHWFPGAEDAYRRIRAGAMLHGKRDDQEDGDDQGIMLFLAEAANAADAEALRAALRASEGDAELGVARGELLAAVVAKSFFAERRAIETDQSLARFAEPLAQILEETR